MKNKTFILIIFLCFLPLFCKGQFCKLYSTHGDISSSMISHIYQDAKGYIWVATENGLNKYDGAKFTNYKNQFNDSTSLLGNHVYRTFQDAKGHLYILSTKGLQMYEYKSDSFKTIKKSNSSYNNKSIAQLSDGSILIGTSGYGIKKLTFDHKGNIQIENWNPSLIGHTINDIMEDRKGNIWICTEYHGMIRIDKNKKIHHYTLGKLYGNQFINCCTEDSNGNIYAGTSGRGVFIYNQADNTFHQIFHSNFPIKVLKQNDNLMLIGIDGEGIVAYDISKKSIANTDFYIDNINIKKSKVHSLLTDSSNNLWIGIYQKGVAFIPSQANMFNYIGNFSSIRNYIGSNCITALCETTDKGKLIVGTDNDGIYLLDKNYNFIQHLTQDKNPDVPPTVMCLFEDSNKKVWIGSYLSGISVFDSQTNKLSKTSLRNNEGNEITKVYRFVEDPHKRLWIGTMGTGLYYVDLPASSASYSDLKVHQALSEKEINLSHYDNSFYIEFATDNFISPQNYLYSMNNGTWNSLPKGSSRVSFSNLPVGKYEFKVKAINGTSESKIKTIVINIHPAWYNSGLAWVIYILIIISIIAIFIHQAKEKYRVRQEMLKHKHLEEINESKLQFFINISHEIRTPMSLIISPLQKLISTDNDSERQKSYSLIERNAQRILNLINQLMDIRKIDKNQMKLSFTEVDLISFINDIKNTFAYQAAAKGAKLNIITQMESLKVWLDPNNFDKVIFNLLSNSFKHIQNEGEINIYINSVNNSSNVYPLNNYAEIIIEDNGTGIKESEMERIFERFYQISDDRSRSKGTGIGLHLSMSLIKMHHGTITVKNNENKSGCSFTIHIPLGCSHLSTEELYQNSNKNISEQPSIEDQPLQHIPASIEENENSEDGTKKVIRKKHSILIVEDEDEIRNYLLTELGSHFRVLSCSNGKEALDLIMHHMPDLVLSDIMMPEVNGITLLRKLKQNIKTNHIPVILLTAKNSEKDYIEGLSLGADAYIAKPFNLDILITTIENLIKNREILRNNFSGKQEQNDNIEVAQPQSADEKLMQKVLKVINKNLNNPDLNAEMIAAEVGISRVHLYRKLKELTNQSTRDFIRNIRLKQAEILLKSEKNYSMSEIAQLVGFNNTTYFSNAFKELYGVSPSKYTERCKEKEEEKKDE